MSGFSVQSEAGRLRTVMLHRPGLEMARLTPANKEALLFDEILWPELAQREHDVFAQLLRDRGVEVLYLHELLAEALESDEARGYVLDAACDERHEMLHLWESPDAKCSCACEEGAKGR